MQEKFEGDRVICFILTKRCLSLRVSYVWNNKEWIFFSIWYFLKRSNTHRKIRKLNLFRQCEPQVTSAPYTHGSSTVKYFSTVIFEDRNTRSFCSLTSTILCVEYLNCKSEVTSTTYYKIPWHEQSENRTIYIYNITNCCSIFM